MFWVFDMYNTSEPAAGSCQGQDNWWCEASGPVNDLNKNRWEGVSKPVDSLF